MRWIAIAVCVAASCQIGAARGQTLYECASRAGHSYQQSPCPPSARTVRSMATVPEPPPSAAQLAARARKAEQDRAESEFLSHLAGTDIVPTSYRRNPRIRSSARNVRKSPQDDGCRLAKANRKTTLQAVGLSRNYDLLQRLDDEVRTACGGG